MYMVTLEWRFLNEKLLLLSSSLLLSVPGNVATTGTILLLLKVIFMQRSRHVFTLIVKVYARVNAQ